MASTDNASAAIGDKAVIGPRGRFTYGHWLQPMINANDQASTETAEPEPTLPEAPSDRTRGRPRVNKVRDASATEVNASRTSLVNHC
jgi:hypothetical protein